MLKSNKGFNKFQNSIKTAAYINECVTRVVDLTPKAAANVLDSSASSDDSDALQ